tara:strand:+ start:389 stop:2296 length:1908 start_codon:yes stop_codon:yes gene_type:complete
MSKTVIGLVGAMLPLCGMLAGCMPAEKTQPSITVTPAPDKKVSASAVPEPSQRRALFGELHLHTSYSFDAYGFSAGRLDPDAAYRFARGEVVNYLGQAVQRESPLDFMAVTDHAEYLGFLNLLDDPSSELAQTQFAKEYLELKETLEPGLLTRQVIKKLANPEMFRQLGAEQAFQSAWQRSIAMTNANYEPGTFTTFIGYEWTSHPGSRFNLHRNVIFNGERAPLPFSALESQRPEDLWRYMEDSRQQGMDVLAIPHNGNASEGNMYAWTDSDGEPIDAEYATRRAQNEPLNEIYQGKGQSETHPLLSPRDEFADFEILDRLVPRLDLPGKPPGSYTRDALGRGLMIEQRTGVNPYKFGAVGATDFHNGLATASEDAIVLADGFDPRVNPPGLEQARTVLQEPFPADPDPKIMGSGGLTGVWAERNDRESLFAAMQRRETFATSGTRLQVRLFGGWSFSSDLLTEADWVTEAYASGVPMGADLPTQKTSSAPGFLVWAVKDPNGANLDRAQIIKVWSDGLAQHETVYDVALSDDRQVDADTRSAPALRSTVDPKNATYRNSVGAVQFATYWRDPDFDPALPAVYYLRVLEIETPRWTTILAARHGLSLPANSPATLQERAWSAPIWYRPPSHVNN